MVEYCLNPLKSSISVGVSNSTGLITWEYSSLKQVESSFKIDFNIEASFLRYAMAAKSEIFTVEMDCEGYWGAVATLYIDGVVHGSKRISTRLTYEAPVEVIVETQIEYIEIEVAKRNLHEVGISMLSLLDKIYDNVKLDEFYGKFIDEGLRIAEELVYAGSNSDDSDASVITQREAVALVNTLDCTDSRRILRQISRVDRELKQLVRKLRTDLSLTREHLDHHNDECTAFLDSIL